MPYDTRLTPQEEARYQLWARSMHRENDTQDYDLRGAWKGNAQQAGNGHLPDTYKKPNHPTFSDESQYSTPQQSGGQWVDDGHGGYVFWASPTNLHYNALGDLSRYFDQVEKGNHIVFPFNWSMSAGR